MHTHTRTNIEAVVVTLQLLRPICPAAWQYLWKLNIQQRMWRVKLGKCAQSSAIGVGQDHGQCKQVGSFPRCSTLANVVARAALQCCSGCALLTLAVEAGEMHSLLLGMSTAGGSSLLVLRRPCLNAMACKRTLSSSRPDQSGNRASCDTLQWQ